MLRTLTIVLLAVASSSLAGEPLRIIDGDGFELNGENVRLWGIDAPEMDQQCSRDGETFQCGAFAKDMLAALIGSDIPDCEKVDTDRYKRTIARCTVGGRDLGSLMVQSGWAVDFTRYSRGHYAFEGTTAKDAQHFHA